MEHVFVPFVCFIVCIMSSKNRVEMYWSQILFGRGDVVRKMGEAW